MIGSDLGSRAQPAADLEPVEARQTDVEDDQIGQRARERLPRPRPVVERFGPVALLAEREAHHLANRVLVFDDGYQARGCGHRF